MHFDNKIDMKRIVVAGIMLWLIFNVISVTADPDRKECAVCGMWIDQYERTRHVIALRDGNTAYFCSAACAVRYVKDNGQKVETIRTADFITEQLVEAEKAFYLQGSDVPGVMSYVSTIAFATRKDAEEFQKMHGGRIIAFTQAFVE